MSQQSPTSFRRAALYVFGYLFSIFLTIEAYILVVRHTLSARPLIITLLTLALVQFCVQVYFFLHIGDDTRPRWRQLTFLAMLVVVVILVIGSLWIMHNLNYHMMTPDQVNHYLHSQDGL